MLSKDPIVHVGVRQSPNSYSYVWNNPLSWVDPSGCDKEPPGLIKTHCNPGPCADPLDGASGGLMSDFLRRTGNPYLSCFGNCQQVIGDGLDARPAYANSPRVQWTIAWAPIPGAGGSEIIVKASRMGGREDYESYRWQALTGVAGGANGGHFISATLPDGSQGWVAGGRASDSANGGVAAIGVTAAFTQTLGGFLAWAEEYSLNGHYGSARVLRGFGIAGAVGGVAISGYAAFDAYRQGDVSGMIFHGAVFAGSVLVVSGVIGISSGPGIVIGGAAVTVTVLDFTRGAP